MLYNNHHGIQWLQYELLAECPKIDFRVFLRHGGVSEEPYASLNFGSRGDESHKIAANIQKAQNILGCASIVKADQQHGTNIGHITDDNKEHTFACDALTTQKKDVALLIRHADCQAACFYDPINQAVSMVHCGWRGNVQDIYQKTIDYMKDVYGSQAANLLVCISPSLGPERSEFINYKTELPESFWQFQYKPFYFDLWALADWQLSQAGILPHHRQLARISTWANPADYFSYRRSPKIGNHGSIALLK
jgi:YfiH family protein